MNKIAVIDGNNVAMASFSTARDMCNSKGFPTGLYFNFLRTLKSIIEQESIDAVYVAWDSKESWRREFYPDYKKARREKPKSESFSDYFDQTDYLKQVIARLGFNQILKPRYEADDIAAYYSKYSSILGKVLLVSNDKDWWQLVTPETEVFMPMKKKKLNVNNFELVTGCPDTESFIKMKSIMGDDGDSVPGVPGVAEITTLKYLKNQLTTSKLEAIENWMKDPEGYLRSRKLVDLVANPPEITPEEITYSEGFLADFFEAFCREMEYHSIMEKLPAWNQTLGHLGR